VFDDSKITRAFDPKTETFKEFPLAARQEQPLCAWHRFLTAASGTLRKLAI